MKYNIISYFLGEGFRNVFKNKKSTFSCLGVMCATMLIFGLFFALGENINYMVKNVESQQGMQIFVKNEATEDEIKIVGDKLKEIQGINSIQFVTKEEAYNQMKNRLADRQELLEGFEPSIFPASYVVTLTDLSLNADVQNKINSLDNIKKITSNDETINTLSNIGRWIRIVTGGTLIILVFISIFIISNTIKLTVHARRKEISIMKYVGATNNFIRAPFMIEGIIIGMLAGILSIILVSVGYNLIAKELLTSSINQNGITILGFNEIIKQIIIVYMVLGVGIGIIGSSLSMKKYLEV